MPRYIVMTVISLLVAGGLYFGYNHFYGDKSPLAAYKRLRKLDTPGCITELTEDGLAFIATGEGRYDQTISNEDMRRIQQQSAFVFAYNQAIKNLAIALDGFDFSNVDKSLWLNDSAVSTTGTHTNDNKTFETRMIKSIKDCFLRGFEFYEMKDPAPYGKVIVRIKSTPKTIRNVNERYSSTEVGCTSIKQGLEFVKNEILNRPMPFIGVRQIYCPQTRETAFVGCGTGLILSSKNERMRAIQEKVAEEKASLRAEAGLCAAIIGVKANSLSFNHNINSDDTKEFQDQIDAESKNNPLDRESQVYSVKPIREIAARAVTGNIISNATEGHIPPGVTKESFLSGDGHWVYTIAVYMPSAERLGRQMHEEMLKGDTVSRPQTNGYDGTEEFQNTSNISDNESIEVRNPARIPSGQITSMDDIGDTSEIENKNQVQEQIPEAIVPTGQVTDINDL